MHITIEEMQNPDNLSIEKQNEILEISLREIQFIPSYFEFSNGTQLEFFQKPNKELVDLIQIEIQELRQSKNEIYNPWSTRDFINQEQKREIDVKLFDILFYEKFEARQDSKGYVLQRTFAQDELKEVRFKYGMKFLNHTIIERVKILQQWEEYLQERCAVDLDYLPPIHSHKNMNDVDFVRAPLLESYPIPKLTNNEYLALPSEIRDKIQEHQIKVIRSDTNEARIFPFMYYMNLHVENYSKIANSYSDLSNRLKALVNLKYKMEKYKNEHLDIFNRQYDFTTIESSIERDIYYCREKISTEEFVRIENLNKNQILDSLNTQKTTGNNSIATKPNTPKKRQSKNNQEYKVNDIKIASYYCNTTIDDAFIQSINTALNQEFTIRPIKYPNGKRNILQASYLKGINLNKEELKKLITQLQGGKKLLNDDKVMKIFKEGERNKALVQICEIIDGHKERLKDM